jgi:hypothetical protein
MRCDTIHIFTGAFRKLYSQINPSVQSNEQLNEVLSKCSVRKATQDRIRGMYDGAIKLLGHRLQTER